MRENYHTVEWLETNRFGSYSSTTLSGCHSRKYHGLLVARLAYPPGKFVLLSKVEDSMFYGDNEVFLTEHQYPGALFPAEGVASVDFCNDRVPTFKYKAGPITVQKEIALLPNEDTVLIRYSCTKNSVGAMLRVKPLLAYRDYHGLSRENLSLRVRTFPAERGFLISPYEGMPTLYMQTDGRFEFFPSPTWYRNFEYLEEMRRGFDFQEDLFSPGVFEIGLDKGASVVISASLTQLTDVSGMFAEEMARRKAAGQKHRGTPFQKTLKRAARQFITEAPSAFNDEDASGRTAVTAGYHWFVEWGRDAMISLPGLLLPTGDEATYLDVLRRFASNSRRGIVPNFLGESPGTNAYNSADAGLWFCFAVQKYLEAVKKPDPLRGEIAAALYDVYQFYQDGTDHGIRMLENGLLTVGGPDEQVTWMDATLHGRPITPRYGCPVEINALWYNLVSFIGESGERLTMRQSVADGAKALAKRIEVSFVETFWLADAGYLADLRQGDWVDRTIRPNQIFAASLPFSPIDGEKARQVVATVAAVLLTPFGLRTLDPADGRYRGRYEGPAESREPAYHNGTVWPWLLGHFGEALLKHSENKAQAIETLNRSLAAFEAHLEDAGYGTISEIFDGDEPQGAKGCIAQAWSVAEILRLSILVDAAQKERARRS